MGMAMGSLPCRVAGFWIAVIGGSWPTSDMRVRALHPARTATKSPVTSALDAARHSVPVRPPEAGHGPESGSCG
jgi:hypothetical protein